MADPPTSDPYAPHLQLAWVESFLAVVDNGGFGAAAQALFRSQSRVSAHIADLETGLGAPLFDRSSRPVGLTGAGDAFLPHARATLRSLRAGSAAVAAIEDLVRGRIALGTYPSAGAKVVPGALADFGRAHSQVRVELVEAAVYGLDEALASGRVDLAVRPELPEPDDEIAGLLLWEEPMQVVMAPDHPLASGDGPLALRDLEPEGLIITGGHLDHDAEAFELLAKEGISPRVAYVSDQPQSLVGLAAAGLGIGFTNALALETIRLDGVRSFDVDPPLRRRAGIFWNSSRPWEPAARALRELFEHRDAPAATHALRPPRPVHGQRKRAD